MIDPDGQIWKVSFRVKHTRTTDDPAITEERKTYQYSHERSSGVVRNCEAVKPVHACSQQRKSRSPSRAEKMKAAQTKKEEKAALPFIRLGEQMQTQPAAELIEGTLFLPRSWSCSQLWTTAVSPVSPPGPLCTPHPSLLTQ